MKELPPTEQSIINAAKRNHVSTSEIMRYIQTGQRRKKRDKDEVPMHKRLP